MAASVFVAAVAVVVAGADVAFDVDASAVVVADLFLN